MTAAAVALLTIVGVGAGGLMAMSGAPTAHAVPSVPPQATPSAPPAPGTPRPTPSRSPQPSPSPTPVPEFLTADLDGLRVDNDLAHRLPIAVLIDDNRVARPQSGFNGASIVYQAPADGGETRYMMVFQEGESADVGPVRSGRIYFAQWAAELRGGISHYGGDRQTRKWIANGNGEILWSIDGMGRGNPAYHRISSRRAPHNAYTSTADLREMVDRLGAPSTISADVHVRPFRDEAPVSERGATQTIRIPYRTGIVTYAYDQASNNYLRSLDGKAQVDPADDRRVTTRNVVVLFMRFSIDTRIEPGHARPVVGSIGSGKAWVFSEGRLVEGTWRKQDSTGPTRLFDKDGLELPLVRGRTFFQIVPTGTKVTHGT
jgi:hypothetical protein